MLVAAIASKWRLTNRWSARVEDKTPSQNSSARGVQRNRYWRRGSCELATSQNARSLPRRIGAFVRWKR